MCENRYNKRSFVWLVILTFAGQRRPIHDVVQTYLHFGLNCWPSCSSLINFAASILQFDQFDQFCCINPPGDLGYSRRRQAQLSNVPTQSTNSHSVFFWTQGVMMVAPLHRVYERRCITVRNVYMIVYAYFRKFPLHMIANQRFGSHSSEVWSWWPLSSTPPWWVLGP